MSDLTEEELRSAEGAYDRDEWGGETVRCLAVEVRRHRAAASTPVTYPCEPCKAERDALRAELGRLGSSSFDEAVEAETKRQTLQGERDVLRAEVERKSEECDTYGRELRRLEEERDAAVKMRSNACLAVIVAQERIAELEAERADLRMADQLAASDAMTRLRTALEEVTRERDAHRWAIHDSGILDGDNVFLKRLMVEALQRKGYTPKAG